MKYKEYKSSRNIENIRRLLASNNLSDLDLSLFSDYNWYSLYFTKNASRFSDCIRGNLSLFGKPKFRVIYSDEEITSLDFKEGNWSIECRHIIEISEGGVYCYVP